MSDSAAAISDNEKNNEIHNSNNRPQSSSFSLKASMLRPSAFGNSTQSATRSILRPSSFQLSGGASGSASGSSTSASQAKSNEADSIENEASPVPTPTSSSPIDETTSKSENSNSKDDEQAKAADSTTDVSVNPFSSPKVNHDQDGDENVPSESGTAAAANVADNKSTTTSTTTSTTAVTTVTLPAAPSLLGKNLFVPTKTTNLFAATTNSDKNIGFVFGQNIHERTAGAPEQSSTINDSGKSDSTGGGELFAAAANHVSSSSASSAASAAKASGSGGAGALATISSADGDSEATASGSVNSQNDSKESSTVADLTKVAQAYEESRGQNKRKFDEVETVTGEEGEVNVLNVNCKLFAFVNSNWEERGPGSLRLNDPRNVSNSTAATSSSSKSKCSRIVFRTSGNLRVLLNTKVWPGMVVEKSSQKSLRLTAIDSSDGQIKIFLAMARPDDISSLNTALKKRIAAEKERVQSQPISDDDDDDDDVDDDENNAEEQPTSATEPNGNHGDADGSNEPSPKREKKD